MCEGCGIGGVWVEAECGGHGGLGERRLGFCLENKSKRGILGNLKVCVKKGKLKAHKTKKRCVE